MDTQHTESSLFEFSFDENVKQQLSASAKWGGIAAMVSIVGTVLGIVNYFIEKANPPKPIGFEGYSYTRSNAETSGQLVTVVISAIIGILLFYFLNKFSKSTKTGIDSNSQQHLSEGLGSLSTYFKFIGVILIICIVFFILAILAGVGSRI
jgi:hypothetical protein